MWLRGALQSVHQLPNRTTPYEVSANVDDRRLRMKLIQVGPFVVAADDMHVAPNF